MLQDDFDINVWGTPEPQPTQATVPNDNPQDVQDDFDDADFAEPMVQNQDFIDDDDFGDFGDEQPLESAGFNQDTSFNAPPIASPSHPSWEPLRLDPIPSRDDLKDQIHHIISPLFPYDISSVTIPDQIREADGISQILAAPESRDLYNSLVSSPPPTKPPNWIRSKIRRQQLIALGIPVNLDEVLPTSSAKPLPPLQISTRPSSVSQSQPPSAPGSRAGTPVGGRRSALPATTHGPKPNIDRSRIDELLALDIDSLTIQPLPQLDRYLMEMRTQTANTSALLTHLLQARDGLQQYSETYNGLIAELVGEAQKMKTGNLKNPPSRRGSGAPA